MLLCDRHVSYVAAVSYLARIRDCSMEHSPTVPRFAMCNLPNAMVILTFSLQFCLDFRPLHEFMHVCLLEASANHVAVKGASQQPLIGARGAHDVGSSVVDDAELFESRKAPIVLRQSEQCDPEGTAGCQGNNRRQQKDQDTLSSGLLDIGVDFCLTD